MLSYFVWYRGRIHRFLLVGSLLVEHLMPARGAVAVVVPAHAWDPLVNV